MQKVYIKFMYLFHNTVTTVLLFLNKRMHHKAVACLSILTYFFKSTFLAIIALEKVLNSFQ